MGHESRAALWRALAFAVVLEALLVPAILFWPQFRDNLDNLKGMVPIHSLRRILDNMGDAGAAGYVTGQQFFKACNTLGTAAAVLFAMGAVAGEAQRGTLELWLARPMSRKRLLFERWLQGALALALPVYLTTASIPWLLTFVEEELGQWPLCLCSTQQVLLLLAIYSATFLCSTMGRSPLTIGFGMLLFMIFEFALYLIQEVTHYSIYRLTDVPHFITIVERERLDPVVIASLALAIAVFLGASMFAFERRVP
jgi:ABC-type transport system involved in multi-copper enzyme maturation permease subunit